MTEMCDETYHGWTNRETWAFHLWVTNEQATAAEARRVVTTACAAMDGAENAGRFVAAEALRVWWRDMLDAARENGYRETLDGMRDDVGSLWRVDWQAVAAAVLDDESDDASSASPGQQHDTRTESDAAVLDHIAHMLRDPDWGVGMLEDVAAWVAATGRTLDGTCASCGHGADLSADETCDADGCECAQHEPTPTWERH